MKRRPLCRCWFVQFPLSAMVDFRLKQNNVNLQRETKKEHWTEIHNWKYEQIEDYVVSSNRYITVWYLSSVRDWIIRGSVIYTFNSNFEVVLLNFVLLYTIQIQVPTYLFVCNTRVSHCYWHLTLLIRIIVSCERHRITDKVRTKLNKSSLVTNKGLVLIDINTALVWGRRRAPPTPCLPNCPNPLFVIEVAML